MLQKSASFFGGWSGDRFGGLAHDFLHLDGNVADLLETKRLANAFANALLQDMGEFGNLVARHDLYVKYDIDAALSRAQLRIDALDRGKFLADALDKVADCFGADAHAPIVGMKVDECVLRPFEPADPAKYDREDED